MPLAYLAGPDVFLPDAPAHAARKAAICAAHGITALPPLNEDVASLAAMTEQEAWRTIFAKDLAMMERADLVIANLTPFRGASADAGTLVELGWLARSRPAAIRSCCRGAGQTCPSTVWTCSSAASRSRRAA